MRIETKTRVLYKFKELDTDAQENAIYEYRCSNYLDFDSECQLDNIAEFADKAGLFINPKKVGYDLDRGAYFAFDGSYGYKADWKNDPEIAYALENKDAYLHDLVNAIDIFTTYVSDKIGDLKGLSVNIGMSRSCLYGTHSILEGAYLPAIDKCEGCNSDCETCQVWDADNETQDKLNEAAEEFIADICNACLKVLQDEWEYVNSDEYISDTIIANEYEFTAEGQFA